MLNVKELGKLKDELEPWIKDLAKFLDKVPNAIELAAILTAFKVHYGSRIGHTFDDDLERLEYAFTNAIMDYVLLKSRSEVGVALAVTHLGVSSLIRPRGPRR